MIWIENDIPLILILHMFTAGVLFFIVGVLLVIRYNQRKKNALRYISSSMFSISLAELILGVLIFLDYLEIEIKTGYKNVYLGIFLWYILLALSNALFVGFITSIFIDDNYQVLIVLTALNAISIGLFLPNITFENIFYTKLKIFLLYFIVISILTYSVVIIQSIINIIKNSNRIIKIGYSFMLLYEILFSLSFISFAFSFRRAYYSGTLYNELMYLTHGLFMLASFFAYLGFIYPEWVKKLVTKNNN